jgi:four helix bundle protein
LTSQIRRAAVSISSNIAEGTSRGSDADFGRFVEIAYGSLMEVVSQTLVAQRLKFMNESSMKLLYDKAEELARMLSGLRGKLRQGGRATESE